MGENNLLGQIKVFVSKNGRRQVAYREKEISRTAVAATSPDSRIGKFPPLTFPGLRDHLILANCSDGFLFCSIAHTSAG